MLKKKKRRSREFKSSNQVISIEEAREERRRKRTETVEKKNKVRVPKASMTERRAIKKARVRGIYILVILVIIAIIGAAALNVVSVKINQGKVQKEQEALLEEKNRLENELQSIESPEYIEQQARQQLKMIKPGELLYVLPDKENKEDVTGSGIIPE